MRAWICCLSVVLSLASCATRYPGDKPDFSLQGDAAAVERARFSMNELLWRQTANTLILNGRRYWVESLDPLFHEISPEAGQRAKTSRFWTYPAFALYIAGAAVLIHDWTDGNESESEDQQLVGFALLTGGVGFSLKQNFELKRAAKIYNQDLNRRFAPTVTMASGGQVAAAPGAFAPTH